MNYFTEKMFSDFNFTKDWSYLCFSEGFIDIIFLNLLQLDLTVPQYLQGYFFFNFVFNPILARYPVHELLLSRCMHTSTKQITGTDNHKIPHCCVMDNNQYCSTRIHFCLFYCDAIQKHNLFDQTVFKKGTCDQVTRKNPFLMANFFLKITLANLQAFCHQASIEQKMCM